MSKLRRREV